jgi:hypothetical protein
VALTSAGCVTTPVVVPPVWAFSRQITPRIVTLEWRRDGWFSATYTDVSKYKSPLDAQDYTRMWATPGTPGKWDKHWFGENLIQAWGESETAALANLLETLDRHGLSYEREEAQGILFLLACATPKTPWEQRAMGVRGKKPRAKRHDWKDPLTGKTIRIYADTLKRHRDPNCTCKYCTMTETK